MKYWAHSADCILLSLVFAHFLLGLLLSILSHSTQQSSPPTCINLTHSWSLILHPPLNSTTVAYPLSSCWQYFDLFSRKIFSSSEPSNILLSLSKFLSQSHRSDCWLKPKLRLGHFRELQDRVQKHTSNHSQTFLLFYSHASFYKTLATLYFTYW